MATRILVADDSATIQKVIKIAFARLAYEIEEAISYPQAANLIQAAVPPQAMILDANLPGLQGPSGIIKLLGGKSLPVLLLVGTYDTIDEDAYRQAGFHHFLRKPFESTDIVAGVEKILPKAAPVGPDNRSQRPPPPPPQSAPHSAQAPTIPPPRPPITPPTEASTGPRPPVAEFTFGLGEAVEPIAGPGKPPSTQGRPLPPVPEFSLGLEAGDEPIGVHLETLEEPMTSQSFNLDMAPLPPVKMALKREGPSAHAPSGSGQANSVPPRPPGGAQEATQQVPALDFSPRAAPREDADPEALRPPPAPARLSPTASPHSPAEFAGNGEVQANLKLKKELLAELLVELRAEIVKSIHAELPSLVSLAVQEYCERHFGPLAKEVIMGELRRLAEEKTRHLMDH